MDDTGASATQTGLGAPEGAEPHAGLGATPAIPCAENVLVSKIAGADIYAIVGPDGRDIGFVRKFFRTIEKNIPGKGYVAWRREAKTPSWRHWLKGEMEPRGGRYCLAADTRKQAIDRLLRDYRA